VGNVRVPRCLHGADIDNDGDIDLIFCSRYNGVGYVENLGGRMSDFVTPIPEANVSNNDPTKNGWDSHDAQALDIRGDGGMIDLVVATEGGEGGVKGAIWVGVAEF